MSFRSESKCKLIMATAYPESTDLFECKVCMEDMVGRQPRTLHCNHTFCHKCLEKISRSIIDWKLQGKQYVEVIQKKITCPTCRRITTVPPPGNMRIYLALNHDLTNIKEHLNHLKKYDDLKTMEMLKPLCDMLSRHKSRPTATKICTECVKKLCDNCAEHHTNLKITKDHIVVPLKLTDTQENATKACLIHKQPAEYICTDCYETLCFECTFDEKHSSHLDMITKFIEGIQILRDKTNKLQEKCEVFHKHATQYVGNMENEIGKLDIAHAELTDTRKIIVSKLESVDVMLEQVSNQKKGIQYGIYNITTSKQKLLSVSKDLEALSAHADAEYVGEFKKLQDVACHTLKRYEKKGNREYSSSKYKQGTLDLTATVAELIDISVDVPPYTLNRETKASQIYNIEQPDISSI